MSAILIPFVFFTVLFFSFPLEPSAEIASENYRVPSSVYSAGGTPSESTHFRTSGIVGQPSPLVDPLDPSISSTFDLYPGFGYVVVVSESTCPGDFNGDRDVDGEDLADYVVDAGEIALDVFAFNFGEFNCP
jgi:hypothetical protein